MDSAGALAVVGVKLLVGVLIDPNNCARREAIRATWMRFPSVGRSVLACFVCGLLGLPALLVADRESGGRADQE